MDRIADRYEVVGELGRGGTATVYEARDRVLHRPCAVKLLTDVGQGAAGQSRRERLQTIRGWCASSIWGSTRGCPSWRWSW